MRVGYMHVSSESNHQITDLQRAALLATSVDGIFGGSGLQPHYNLEFRGALPL